MQNVKFDVNAFSNIQDQHVIGLAFNDIHIGGVNSSTRTLQLFHVQPTQPIAWVLQDFITDQSASSAPYQCDDAQRSEFKRKFILLRSKTHGLADLRINENIENIHVDMQNCHVKNNRKF